MKKELDENEIQEAIATINHNIECLEEAVEIMKQTGKSFSNDIRYEKRRLKKLLSFYEKLRKE